MPLRLSDENMFDILKCICEKKGGIINDPNLEAFIKNGISLPKFISLITNVSKIPHVLEKVHTNKQKKDNNTAALKFLQSIKKFKCWAENINSNNYSSTIKQFFKGYYYSDITLQEIMTQSKKLFKTIGINLHKENEIYNGLYIIRLLHILTDHEVQLIDEFNESTDFDQILSPIFNKYHIPFIITSFDFDQHENTFLQYQIIFDKYEEKIKSILENRNETDDDDDQEIKYIINEHEIEDENSESSLFLFANVVGKDFGLRLYNFGEIIEEGFIPKFVMHQLHINSIENVTDINSNSIDVQIKNIEAVVDYLRKGNPSIDYHLFDFRTISKRNFSICLLLRCLINLYYLKPKEELIKRFYIITETINKKKLQFYYQSDIDEKLPVCHSENLMKIAFFIKNGRTNCTFRDFELSSIWPRLPNYCHEINVPLIINNDKDEFFSYLQLQIFYYIIEKRKSLLLIELFKNIIYSMKRIRVPKFSTIANSIKVKRDISKDNVKTHHHHHMKNDDDEEEDDDEIVKLPIKMKKHPTTFKKRYKKKMMTKDDDQDQDSQKVDDDSKSQIDDSKQFWNPKELLNKAHLENGILLLNEQKSDDESLEKWNDSLNLIQKMETKNDQNSIDVPHSNKKKILYKLFSYNEKSNKWVFNENTYQRFCNNNKLYVENNYNPLVCYIDSNEDDLISFNSNFIYGIFPEFDQNEIFVYVLYDNQLIKLNNKSIKPIFLLIHVPKEKENLPNIDSIIIKIYTFLSLICDIRIVVLNKSFYQIQIQNLISIFNIVGTNINELIKSNEEEKEEKDKNSYFFSLLLKDKIKNETTHHLCYNDGENKMIYRQSKTIFLINDDTIKNYNSEIDKSIANSKLFTSINALFNNQIIMHIINVAELNTYKGFLDTFNSICLEHKYKPFNIHNNFVCIKDVSYMSDRYISIKKNIENQSSIIKSTIQERFSCYKSNQNLSQSVQMIQNEIFQYSPKFDLSFHKDCKKAIKDRIVIDRDILKKELNQSATEHLGYFIYKYHKKFFDEITHIEKLLIAHSSFLEEEYFNIIKILAEENTIGLLYDQNIDILNEQNEKDQELIQEIFSPFIKKIKMKNTPKEEKFEDIKQKGTSYIMKETESIREIKVTLQMKDDLKTIIEQDF